MEFTTKLKIGVATLVLAVLGFAIIPNLDLNKEESLGASISSPSSDGGSLVGAWTLNQDDVNNAGTSIKDKSGNGNDGAITRTDLMDGWDFDVDNWLYTYVASHTSNSYTTDTSGGLFGQPNLTNNHWYKIVISGSTKASGFEIHSTANGSVSPRTLICDHNSTGAFSLTTTYQVLNNQIDLYLRNDDAGTTDITTFEIEDITFNQDQNGVPNQAMTFDGTTDIVNCGSGTTIDDIFDGGGTVSAWINPSSDGERNEGRIIEKRFGWTIVLIEEDPGVATKLRILHDFSTIDGHWTTNSEVIPINTWIHVSISYDNDAVANNPIFYINGVPYTVASGLTESQTPVGTRVSEATNDLYIGNNAAATRTFDGSISDAMLFSSALTEDQVRQLYLSGRTTAKIKIDARSLITGTDSDFSGASNWENVSFASYDETTGGKLTLTAGDATYQYCRLPIINAPMTAGKTYKLTFTSTNQTGQFQVKDYTNDQAYGDFSTNGTHTLKFTSVNAGGVMFLNQVAFGTVEIDDIKLVDITNAITPKLQKGLILDMPLNSRYTDGFSTTTGNYSITKDRTPYGNDGTVSGATIKYDGLVNAGDGIAYINQDKAYGTWEFDVNKGTSHSFPTVGIISDNVQDLVSTNGNNYHFLFNSEERIYLRKGIFNLFKTGASYIAINTDYRIKITRSLAGVFTMYIKGGTFGWDDWTTVVADSGTNPVTDNTYTTSNYFVADLDDTDTVSNLKIDGKRISLSGAVQSTGTWTTTGPAYDFDGTDDVITIGNVGTTAKTISFWVSLDSTTESILEETDDVGVSVSTGTMSYGSWDNCFIDGVDTDTITTGWHQVILTSTTNVDVSALRLGLVDTTYLDGQLSKVKVFNRVLSASDISYLYSKEVNLF